MEQQPQEREAELVDSSHALAIEISGQRQMAIAQPRNPKAVFESAITELEMDPEFAEDAYYEIPVNSRDDDEGGDSKPKFITGLSVVSSRSIQRLWGNCASASRIVGETDSAVEVEGVFADFETNTFFRSTVRVPKTYIPRKSKIPVPLRVDALNKAIQAGCAKAERNSALKGIPEWFKTRYYRRARQLAAAGAPAGGATAAAGTKPEKTVAERLQAVCKAFAGFGITEDRVQAYVKSKFDAAVKPEEVLATMRGIYNAIRDKQVQGEEVFAAPASKPSGQGGAVKLEDVMGAEQASAAGSEF
ncbi:MAG: hypothetical protein NTY77_05470 [Elusimicrobia bacterium]|nr:hypothetical protein [Elusimicrobiota bacterium]